MTGYSAVDVIIIAPGAFVLGAIIGYIIRAKYNGKGKY